MPRGFVSLLAWMGAAALAVCAPAPAASQTRGAAPEHAVKAVYLVRFAAFVEWPPHSFASPEAPLVLCVAGRSPVAPALQAAVRNQTANGRPLLARNLLEPAGTDACHVVYLGAGGAALIAATPDASPMLRVTDAAITTRPGMIHFDMRDGRVRFHVDQTATRRAGLRLSSRLLSLALSVRGVG